MIGASVLRVLVAGRFAQLFLLAGRPTLADEPDLFVAWQVLVRAFSGAGKRSACDATNSHRRERRPERSFGAAPPCDGPPLLQLKRVVRRERPDASLWRGRPRGATGQVSTTSGE